MYIYFKYKFVLQMKVNFSNKELSNQKIIEISFFIQKRKRSFPAIFGKPETIDQNLSYSPQFGRESEMDDAPDEEAAVRSGKPPGFT